MIVSYNCSLGRRKKHLVVTGSDHVPLLFHISSTQQVITTVKKPFRFENMWTKEAECQKVVSKSWNGYAIRNCEDLA